MNIKNFLGIATVALFLIAGATYAFAEDRTDCINSMKNINDNVTISNLTEGEVSAVLAKRGPPPGIAAPYSFTVVSNGELAELIVHDKDCVLMVVGPASIESLNKFLGRVEANNG